MGYCSGVISSGIHRLGVICGLLFWDQTQVSPAPCGHSSERSTSVQVYDQELATGQ